MGNEDLSTIPKMELDEFIKSSVEDLVPILSESENTSESDSDCDLLSCDDFSPINVYEEKSVTFSNPLFDSNDDFTSSDDESLSNVDVLEDNVKIYSNPLFEFDDEYISSDVSPLFDEVLENIESDFDEIDAFLDMDISTDIENGYYDSKSSHTAKEMTWHATGKCTEPGKMQHPVDGRAWKDFDTKYLDFAAEPRNVRLGLAADGFNPFGNLSQSYSMWPDIDVYLRPLIDDLKVLWAKPGVETIDVATGLKFNMRAMVLWTINDFPARSSLSGWSGQGYKACPTCNEDTPSVRVLGKTAYVGHRRFLKKPHKWRRSLEFNGETENGDPPNFKVKRSSFFTELLLVNP
ncbi:hypothetical protein Tco_0486952 [Tanacetum coccineum]